MFIRYNFVFFACSSLSKFLARKEISCNCISIYGRDVSKKSRLEHSIDIDFLLHKRFQCHRACQWFGDRSCQQILNPPYLNKHALTTFLLSYEIHWPFSIRSTTLPQHVPFQSSAFFVFCLVPTINENNLWPWFTEKDYRVLNHKLYTRWLDVLFYHYERNRR